jgi:hypothetical protein
MLSKIERQFVTILDLKNDSFIRNANYEQVKEFLIKPTKKLSEALAELGEGYRKYKGKSKMNVNTDVINNVQHIVGKVQVPNSKEDRLKMEEIINEYIIILNSKKDEVRSFLLRR